MFCFVSSICRLRCYLHPKTNTGKPNGIVITEDLREELVVAATTSAQAFTSGRNPTPGEEIVTHASLNLPVEDIVADKRTGGSSGKEEGQLNAKVLVMQPILRFLQLLCENHNRELQVRYRSNIFNIT